MNPIIKMWPILFDLYSYTLLSTVNPGLFLKLTYSGISHLWIFLRGMVIIRLVTLFLKCSSDSYVHAGLRTIDFNHCHREML